MNLNQQLLIEIIKKFQMIEIKIKTITNLCFNFVNY